MKKWLIFVCLHLLALQVFATELQIRVQVQAPQVANINTAMVNRLQQQISNFINNNRWTNENYLPQERITGDLIITITNWDNSVNYAATAQLQSRRAVFGSTYQSVLLNLSDQQFNFNYTEGEVLDQNEQTFRSNLSALLSYYALTMIGMDKDSFAALSGNPYFERARQVLQLAQNSGFPGWNPADGLRNRYWLNENLLNKSYEALRVFSYYYHRRSLDLLYDNRMKAAQQLTEVLPVLQQMDKQQFGSYFPTLFMTTKAEELSRVLAFGTAQQRQQAHQLLLNVDRANAAKYELISGRK